MQHQNPAAQELHQPENKQARRSLCWAAPRAAASQPAEPLAKVQPQSCISISSRR